MQLLFQ